jgi:hypothetical protein
MAPLIEHRDLRSWQQCLLVVNADSCRSLVIQVRDIPQLGYLLSEWRPCSLSVLRTSRYSQTCCAVA